MHINTTSPTKHPHVTPIEGDGVEKKPPRHPLDRLPYRLKAYSSERGGDSDLFRNGSDPNTQRAHHRTPPQQKDRKRRRPKKNFHISPLESKPMFFLEIDQFLMSLYHKERAIDRFSKSPICRSIGRCRRTSYRKSRA